MEYVSKDFKMLIAAVFIIAKLFEALFMLFNRRMVEWQLSVLIKEQVTSLCSHLERHSC